METEKRILETARQLFNEHGTDGVTVRQIAAEMKISHGNLCYHYPSTGAIIRALYEELVLHFSEAISGISSQGKPLLYIREASRAVALKMYEYRFFFLDFVHIIRRDEWIRRHYRKLMQARQEQFQLIFGMLVKKGWLQPERLPGQYDALTELQFLSGDFWLSRAVIKGIKGKEKQIDFFMKMQLTPLISCLTEKGWKELQASEKKENKD